MSEDDLLKAVLEMARVFGIMTAHFRTAQARSGNWVTAVSGDGKGYPDLTMVGPRGMLFRELKSARGPTAPEQKAWLARLTATGADAAIWRPADLKSGRIEAELRAIMSAKGAGVAGASRKPPWMK